MKISTFIYIMLFVGVIFFVMTSMVNEANSKYNTGINTSQWEGKYDYSESVNLSVSNLSDSINTLSNSDNGWLKVEAGFTGIISAVKLLPALIGNSFINGGAMITGGFSSIGLPAYLIAIFLIGLTIWGVVKLLEFFQRWTF
jgi:hypothetical protein